MPTVTDQLAVLKQMSAEGDMSHGDLVHIENTIAVIEKLMAERIRFRNALTRLASPEAFCVAKMSNDEERARMQYAQLALRGCDD